MWHQGTRCSDRTHKVRLMVGRYDIKGLFQPRWLHDSAMPWKFIMCGTELYAFIGTHAHIHTLKVIADITEIPPCSSFFSWQCLFTLIELFCSNFSSWMPLAEQEFILIYSIFAVTPREEGIRVRCLTLISFKRLVNLHSSRLRWKSWLDSCRF